nr:FHA domain-containing protein [Conyzicola lurida]
MPPPGIPAAPVPSPLDEEEAGFIDLPPGITVEPVTVTAPVERPLDDVVFVPTVIGAAPVLPAVEPVPEPVAEPVEASAAETNPVTLPQPWRLVPPTGDAIPVTGTLLLGRNPAASDRWPDAGLVALADETRSVSKTHALLELDDDAVWVSDLDSTNGVYVVTEGAPVEVVPGERVQIRDGAAVELGDYVLRLER